MASLQQTNTLFLAPLVLCRRGDAAVLCMDYDSRLLLSHDLDCFMAGIGVFHLSWILSLCFTPGAHRSSFVATQCRIFLEGRVFLPGHCVGCQPTCRCCLLAAHHQQPSSLWRDWGVEGRERRGVCKAGRRLCVARCEATSRGMWLRFANFSEKGSVASSSFACCVGCIYFQYLFQNPVASDYREDFDKLPSKLKVFWSKPPRHRMLQWTHAFVISEEVVKYVRRY